MDTETRIKALAKYLECDIDDLNESSYNEQIIECEEQEYLVATDNEADDVWDDRLESYIDECILPDLPENVRFYFDNEKWKEDAKIDGRGHSISSYDGGEDEVEIGSETLYIFRLN